MNSLIKKELSEWNTKTDFFWSEARKKDSLEWNLKKRIEWIKIQITFESQYLSHFNEILIGYINLVLIRNALDKEMYLILYEIQIL